MIPPPLPVGMGAGRFSGWYGKISFGFVIRTLKNPLVPSFIKIWWKYKFQNFAPNPPFPQCRWGGGEGEELYSKISFGFMIRILKNLLVQSFIQIWWKFQNSPPPPSGDGGWWRGLVGRMAKLALDSWSRPSKTHQFRVSSKSDENKKFKILAVHQWGGGAEGPPPYEFFQFFLHGWCYITKPYV